jgi:hypothetical protein
MIQHTSHHIQKNTEYTLPKINEIDSNRTHVIVPTNIFTKDDTIYKVGLLSKDVYIAGSESSIRQDIVLQYGTSNEPIAVCKLMLGGSVTYKVYTTKPNYTGQQKSRRKHNESTDLYTYAEMKRSNKKCRRQLKLISPSSTQKSVSYEIETFGTRCRKTITNDGLVVSFAQCRNIDDMSTHLLLSPGTDPYLMVCVEAMCERLDILEREI